MYSLRSSDWLTLPLVHLTDWFIELESKLCRLEILLDCKIKKLTTFWETRSLASSARDRESCYFRILDCKHVMFFVTSILAYSYLVYLPWFMINIYILGFLHVHMPHTPGTRAASAARATAAGRALQTLKATGDTPNGCGVIPRYF